MVMPDVSTLGRRAARGLRQDLDSFFALVAGLRPPDPGMYTYHVTPPDGKIRIHLRIEPGGSGVLFVDVSEVIHLNPTAAEMAKLALDDVPLDQARAALTRRYRPSEKDRISSELAQMYAMIDAFRNPGDECPTCAVTGLERAPLFSTRAMAPYKADLALTYGCNNKCPHCYNEPDRFEMASLPKGSWFEVVDRLYEVGVPHIIFTGGEATLHPKLPDIIHYADSLGMVTGLNTNGRRIAHLPYMRELAEAGLNHVQVTLGSSRPEVHNAMMGAVSFHQTVHGIQNALACGALRLASHQAQVAHLDVVRVDDGFHC